MDIEQARTFVDEMEAERERWERQMGSREMIAWIVTELRRRRELRESGVGSRDTKALEMPTPAHRRRPKR